ncbi:MAG: AAA family ATPase, partial [Thermoplasmata archaeon]|nr:AAA family ATPase [Thermoplasmata archaeon]
LKLGKRPKYWRKKSKLEIDFVVEHNNCIVSIEVKLQPDKAERSLRSFISQYKPKTAFIIGYNVDYKEENIDGCKIISSDIRSLYEYFSSKPGGIQ